jgi:hypothetical protein
MKTAEALKIIGGSLSKPSKMPGWSIGLPAKECKTGAKLQAVPGSVCYDCYAMKGCYVFKVVQDAQYRRLKQPSRARNGSGNGALDQQQKARCIQVA